MVERLKYLFFFLIFSSSLFAGGVKIEVEVDSDLASEHQPIMGKMIISHPEGEAVDENSFSLNNSPLNMQLLSEGKQSSITIVNGKRREYHQVISCYYFEIPGQKQGKYKLNPISVKVGNSLLSSNPISYEIHGTQAHAGFSLERFIETSKEVYPGQRIIVGYRLALRTQIEITREHFPLFNPPGFTKVGERKIRQYRRGNANVYEFCQELEAQDAGSFQIEESYIEGLAFKEDFFSRRIYTKPKLRAKAQPITISIKEFPIEDSPTSFDGAVGKFTMDVELLSHSEICVGDKIELKITFKGKGLETLKLPHFAKQKEIRENFRFSDLPPAGKIVGSSKIFNLEIRPLKDSIACVPPLEFSFFDSSSQEYKTLKSEAIALKVQPLPQEVKEILVEKKQLSSKSELKSEVKKEKILKESAPPLIEIAGVFPLSKQDLEIAKPSPFKIGLVFLLFALLILQFIIKKLLNKRGGNETKSHHLLKEAFKYPNELQKYHDLLEKAFRLRLKEKNIGDLSSSNNASKAGVYKEVQSFLDQMQHDLFSGKQQFDFKRSQKEARKLFKMIGDLG